MSDETTPDLHKPAMERFESSKRYTEEGVEFWTARELGPLLGYPIWQNFEPAIQRAHEALAAVGRDPSHEIMPTHKRMGSGQTGRDYFLSRGASYLIAMNGDPSKTEVAAAQIYFASKTRQMELVEQRSDDEKRLELREKITQSQKRVSSVAKAAGVRDRMQGVFHDARYRGLYQKPAAAVKKSKGLTEKDNLFDRAGPLELSANDFQMNLAADVIERDKVKGEQKAIDTNLSIAKRVRSAILESGATLPEDLALEEPISAVKKRLSNSGASKSLGGKR